MSESMKHWTQHEFDGMFNGCLRLVESDVDQVLTPEMALEAVRAALKAHSQGDTVQPLKIYTRPRGRSEEYVGGRFIAMPAYVGGSVEAAGIKWIAGFPRNVEMNLPRASARLLLNSVVTGKVIADMECAVLSARRTGAVAALCIESLAVKRPLKVALLGTGPISHSVLEAVLDLPTPVREVRVYDPKSARVEQMQAGFGDAVRLVATKSVRECVRNADVVVTAVTGSKGYLERPWIVPGCLLVMLSLDDPTDDLFLNADKVITDDFDQCNREQKLIHRLVVDGRFDRRKVHADLGDILAGAKVGREHGDEIILVNPMGMAVEDVAVGKAVYVAAKQEGLGQYVPPAPNPDVPDGFIFKPKIQQGEERRRTA